MKPWELEECNEKYIKKEFKDNEGLFEEVIKNGRR